MANARNFSQTTTLSDGRILTIRAIRPSDKHILISEFDKLHPRDVYQRFFFAKTGLTQDELAYLTNVDFKQHVALVASVWEEAVEHPAGVGRFVAQTENGLAADIALIVARRFRGLGVGTQLLKNLTCIARNLGYSALTGEILASNQTMLDVLVQVGLPMEVDTVNGVTEVLLKLS